MISSFHGHNAVVEMLLSHHADVDTCLAVGAKINHEDKRGVLNRVLSIDGTTSLWMAAYSGHLEVVKALIAAGAKVDHEDKVRVSSDS